MVEGVLDRTNEVRSMTADLVGRVFDCVRQRVNKDGRFLEKEGFNIKILGQGGMNYFVGLVDDHGYSPLGGDLSFDGSVTMRSYQSSFGRIVDSTLYTGELKKVDGLYIFEGDWELLHSGKHEGFFRFVERPNSE